MSFTWRKRRFFVSEQQNLFLPHTSFCAATLGNICLHNNVSATLFPSLARPLQLQRNFRRRSAKNSFARPFQRNPRKFDRFFIDKIKYIRNILWLVFRPKKGHLLLALQGNKFASCFFIQTYPNSPSVTDQVVVYWSVSLHWVGIYKTLGLILETCPKSTHQYA